ncbi:MAG: UbiD family decarboxylase [Chloroflexi bacterium]|nr:UbiD family decarboxylase [Chloroflexota bacterium]
MTDVRYTDLRGWLGALAAAGMLLHTRDALARGEQPALAPLIAALDGPALLRASPGRLAAALGLYRAPGPLAIALELPPSTGWDALLSAAAARRAALVDAEFVAPSAAACKQVVLRGAAADLRRIVPQAVGPLQARLRGVAICGCPAEGLLQLGLVAVEPYDAHHARLWPALPRDPAWAWLRAAAEHSEAVPVAVASGVAPCITLAAAEQQPLGDPYAIASALQQAPVRVTEGESSELEIPAHAELVIEGHLAGRAGDALLLAVDVLSHRRDATAEYWPPGTHAPEAALLQRVARGAGVHAVLAATGRAVRAVALYAWDEIELAIIQCAAPVGPLDALLDALRSTAWAETRVFVVGPGVDPFDPAQVLRACMAMGESHGAVRVGADGSS